MADWEVCPHIGADCTDSRPSRATAGDTPYHEHPVEPAPPTEREEREWLEGQWVHCSPDLISAGVDCGRTPRRPCACCPDRSEPLGHDHFIAFRLRRTPDTRPETRAEMKALCHSCGAPAACIGRYEMMTESEYACDDCCGHGNEDGWCWLMSEIPDEVDALFAQSTQSDALEALRGICAPEWYVDSYDEDAAAHFMDGVNACIDRLRVLSTQDPNAGGEDG